MTLHKLGSLRHKTRQKVVFIVGTSFCGSTLLGSSLNSENVSFISEADRFFVFSQHSSEYELHDCSVCALSDLQSQCPVFGQKRVAAIQQHTDIKNKYLELIAPLGDIVVDSSKGSDWSNFLIDGGLGNDVDLFAIIATRNPVAFAFSDNPVAFAFSDYSSGRQYWKSVIGWRETYNHAIRSLIHRYIPYIVVKYEDLFVPEKLNGLIRGLSSLVHNDFQINLANRSIRHALGGNLGAYIGSAAGDISSWNKSKTFDSGNEWKMDYPGYKESKITESKRWVDIGKDQCSDLLDIPGVSDLCSLFGYSHRDIYGYF